MLYVIIIILGNCFIIAFNSLWGDFLKNALLSIVSTVTVIAVDGITAFLVRKLPEKYFSAQNRFFKVSKKERNFYKKLYIKQWKDKVPELGVFTGFHKDKVQNKSDKAHLERFLLESNYGVIIHLVNALFGFLIILIPFCGKVSIALPVALVNFVLSMLPVFVLRYNTPILLHLYKKAR